MFLYNITYNIDKEISSEWLAWMRLVYIPKILATGYFESCKLYQLLNVDDDGITYSFQFFTNSIDKIQCYLEQEATLLAEEHNVRYKNRHVAFSTVLQEI